MINGNKSLKISLLLIAAGVVLMGVGYLFGGSNTLHLNHNGISFNDSKNIVHEKNPIDSFENINWDAGSCDVDVLKGNEYEIETTYDKSLVDLKYSVSNNTLNISSSDKNHSSFNIVLFGCSNNNESSKVTIYVPNDSDVSEIKGKVASGDINIQDLKCKTANITCSSGDTKFSNLNCNNMKIQSSSGSITLDNINTNDMNLDSSSGSIKINNLKSKNLVCDVTSGSMHLDNLTADHSTLKSSSGSIKINDIVSNGLNITSKSGSVKLQGELKGENIIDSSSGSIEFNSSLPETDYSYDLHATSGNCNVDGKSNDNSCKKENPSSTNKITATCRSGGIKVNFKR